jgi:pimeloyl-ACP methyl ester carboxylesterase
MLKKKIRLQFDGMPDEHFRAFYAHSEFVRSLADIGELIDFSCIAAKTLILYGRKDTICDLGDVEHLSQVIPNAELQVLEGVGHFLHFEDQSVMRVYDAFYRRPVETRISLQNHAVFNPI